MSYPKHGPLDARAYRAKRRCAFGLCCGRPERCGSIRHVLVHHHFDGPLPCFASVQSWRLLPLLSEGPRSTDEWVRRARERVSDLLGRRRQEREKVISLEGSEDAPEHAVDFCTATLPGGGVVLRARSTNRSGKLDGDELGEPAVDRTSAGSHSL